MDGHISTNLQWDSVKTLLRGNLGSELEAQLALGSNHFKWNPTKAGDVVHLAEFLPSVRRVQASAACTSRHGTWMCS